MAVDTGTSMCEGAARNAAVRAVMGAVRAFTMHLMGMQSQVFKLIKLSRETCL
jgi:hypothetical protein